MKQYIYILLTSLLLSSQGSQAQNFLYVGEILQILNCADVSCVDSIIRNKGYIYMKKDDLGNLIYQKEYKINDLIYTDKILYGQDRTEKHCVFSTVRSEFWKIAQKSLSKNGFKFDSNQEDPNDKSSINFLYKKSETLNAVLGDRQGKSAYHLYEIYVVKGYVP